MIPVAAAPWMGVAVLQDGLDKLTLKCMYASLELGREQIPGASIRMAPGLQALDHADVFGIDVEPAVQHGATYLRICVIHRDLGEEQIVTLPGQRRRDWFAGDRKELSRLCA